MYTITVIMAKPMPGVTTSYMVTTKLRSRMVSIFRSWKSNLNVAAIFIHEDDILTDKWVSLSTPTQEAPNCG